MQLLSICLFFLLFRFYIFIFFKQKFFNLQKLVDIEEYFADIFLFLAFHFGSTSHGSVASLEVFNVYASYLLWAVKL